VILLYNVLGEAITPSWQAGIFIIAFIDYDVLFEEIFDLRLYVQPSHGKSVVVVSRT
jgi:hypothetical protein